MHARRRSHDRRYPRLFSSITNNTIENLATGGANGGGIGARGAYNVEVVNVTVSTNDPDGLFTFAAFVGGLMRVRSSTLWDNADADLASFRGMNAVLDVQASLVEQAICIFPQTISTG